ncbi:MAG TPA: sulfatase-like hydrolase/transferase [Thermoanaerobaculia bacterium]|nr:sulfatase-like hydrolase/transferase [Thermoanaerobaculia bacterium]
MIVISVDTLRADHLPAYGYKGVETPHIDALRRDGVLFERAYSHAPLTLPSHVSMLTGKLPFEHGVRNNLGFSLASSVPTLPSLLKSRGYATGAAVSAYVLRGTTGLAASFDDYDDAVAIRGGESFGAQQRPGRETVAVARTWIERHKGAPFFYMLHLFEPHTPYTPPEPHRSRWALPYDGEIATADEIVGELIASLKQQGIYDDALIVFLSDHGEGLGDHGEAEHGIFLYQEAIRVPLIVKLPGNARANSSSAAPVGLTDVFATVARTVGAEAAGVSLFDPPRPRRIYAESLYPRIHLGWSELRSLVDETHQYIEAPKPELYDLAADPSEKSNVLSEQRRVYAALRTELEKLPRGESTTGNIDPEEAKKLAALGYLSATAPSGGGPLPDPKDRIGELATLQRASMLVKERRYAEAIASLRSLVAANPRLTDAWSLLARTQQDAGDFDGAIATYRQTLSAHPQLAGDLGLSVAGLYLTKGDLAQAEAHARLGESTNPSLAHLMLGRVAMARGDYDAAMQHAQSVSNEYGYRVQGLVLAAQVYSRARNADRALQLLAQADREIAERKLGAIPLLEYTRGDALARLERFDEAEAAFRREIRDFPEDREAWASLAVIQWLRGQRDASRATMEQYVRANPSPDARAFAAKTFRELNAPPS